MHDSISADDDDDEYCSSRNIAISLLKRFKNAVDRGGGDNLKVYSLVLVGLLFVLLVYCLVPNNTFGKLYQEFISAGVNAYALGCTDEGLRKELNDMKESGVEIEAMQSYGGTKSLKSKIISEEVRHFCLVELELFARARVLSIIDFTSYIIAKEYSCEVCKSFIQLYLKQRGSSL